MEQKNKRKGLIKYRGCTLKHVKLIFLYNVLGQIMLSYHICMEAMHLPFSHEVGSSNVLLRDIPKS